MNDSPTERASEAWWRGWLVGSLAGAIFVWLLLVYGPLLGLPSIDPWCRVTS
jgi:hypothetical protein